MDTIGKRNKFNEDGFSFVINIGQKSEVNSLRNPLFPYGDLLCQHNYNSFWDVAMNFPNSFLVLQKVDSLS